MKRARILLALALLTLSGCGSMDRLRVVERSGEDREAVAVASFVEELRRGEDARAYQAWGKVLPAPAEGAP